MSVLYTREEEGVWLDHYDHQEVPGLMELHMGELEVAQISSLLHYWSSSYIAALSLVER